MSQMPQPIIDQPYEVKIASDVNLWLNLCIFVGYPIIKHLNSMLIDYGASKENFIQF